jgi:amino acid transporter
VSPDDEQRTDRQMMELLNELRVALPGVQFLFAFLLTVPFTQRFTKLTSFERTVYFVTLMATITSAAFLIAPSAAHRLRFHMGERPWLVESASRMLLAGLVALAVAITGAVLLIGSVMFGGLEMWLFAIAVALGLVLLWFVRPLLHGRRSSGP